jgi:manganese/zinc/iron transport system permease protein
LSATQVLATLYGLATRHKDPAYPCEQGMIDTYHGPGTRRALARLLERGLVRQTAHMPTEGVHWELTPAGFEQALRVLEDLHAGDRRCWNSCSPTPRS